MLRFIHSLRFQLPAVLLGLFILILGLWVLLFREISTITGKTRALNLSAEVSDRVTEWSNYVATAARERTKFMTLSKETYLDGFLASVEDFGSAYEGIEALTPVGNSPSLGMLRDYEVLNREYQGRAQAYAWEWRNSEKLRLQWVDVIQKPLPQAMAQVSKASPLAKPAKAAKVGKAGTSPKAGKKKAAKYAAAGPKSKVGRGKKASRTASPPPALAAARKAREEALLAYDSLIRRRRYQDSLAADAFKALEGRLREGLQQVQGELRQERMEKQQSLHATISRAKHRLIYSLVLLTLMVAYVAYILQWKILEPLSRLENGAVQIGRGYLGFRVEVDSKSEIGDLAQVLNTMSERLAKHRDGEMRLKRLDAIQQVVRSVNHEINNPLMIISGNAEYLLTILDNQDEGVKEKLNTIVAEVRRIFYVTQQLKEIKDLVSSNYTSDQDKMIDLARSSQVIRRAW